ncbi:Membrane protein insertase YidC [Dissostichus eleginoides]|uniref:Membrane protein insertase YidC n=1 Tax=Dissostichus eleginoides TaxID=100907 RepID=A0AAD9F756_DISEL|nr:Membrane protein insertase YidC [Dissostichus eleginoides]
MSVLLAESCFMSAMQPNSSCTAYVLPSDGPPPGPAGSSPPCPGAGPDAAGGEEVLLPAPAGRLAGRINRWNTSRLLSS